MSSINKQASCLTLTSPLFSLSLGRLLEGTMDARIMRAIMHDKAVEGILFFTPENIRYLTGFSGSEGYLLAQKDENLLLVDSRYITQAREETTGCQVALLDKRLKGLKDYSAPLGLQRLGFEAQGISVARFEQLQKEALQLASEQGINLKVNTIAGHAAQSIVRFAEQGGYDLLVIGHSGRSGVWGSFLGSTADKIVRHAKCPVLVMR